MANVGIPSAPNIDPRFNEMSQHEDFRDAANRPHDPDAITENDIRAQFALRQRVRYPMIG